jgi:tRNA(fMet)-specific endonuclease VapC
MGRLVYLLDTNSISEPIKENPHKNVVEKIYLFSEQIAISSLEAADWHGKEAARLQSIGKSPPFIDGQIAAVAKVNNLILVMRNTDDFKHFSDIQLDCGLIHEKFNTEYLLLLCG